MRFRLPSPPAARPRVFPVFLPFAGCPHRCLFCAQDAQSGSRPRPLSEILNGLNAEFERRHALRHVAGKEPAAPLELAFYGGTFTALPPQDQLACLRLARVWRQKGLITAVRCSTRPDALSPAWLAKLKDEGLHRIEVGVQSFDTAALRAVGRGHDGGTAVQGCGEVLTAGLELGIQLLPGMPGVSPDIFLRDVRQALRLCPATLRFYPCLVIEGTALAALWRQGEYVPWSLEQTVSTLGKALGLAWKADVPVIRLSVAPEPALEPLVLAGPRHPALGGMIHSEALFETTAGHAAVLRGGAASSCALRLRLPSRCRGFFPGHKGALLPRWRALGVAPGTVEWHEQDYAELLPVL